ncbi:hypothetical protein CO116_00980 [Candidatus Falkowbacteria bacterium CG_4_9_14_3_um_filter_38_19]|uniref:DUF3048 domain-containing protein n=2 Tax=Candidatus Falkowiibacteriota TaxID=1752728 RepID=A0A2M6WRT8_9BACT|nr:DUF3048 domain-containing protein [Candidatus Falkowbacteria bacterium]PIT95482.1 MAG: hypothetical protein COT96_01025 [Candidatus Falkowbacteria bacterium CG10_big_fil_rev_8_21_14_0_10_38_22]PJB17394.1 MAG: hypothetical protein CO116_00980 [Candidatus Falkowbacteria bacterium CG_4_9_14_3_um_filter_38_19]
MKVIKILYSKKRFILGSVFILLLIIFTIFIIYLISYRSEIVILNQANPTNPECLPVAAGGNCVRRLLDGVYVELGKENFQPLAVMIENHPDARPPAGLARANLVYEAEAEAGITRFLAVYASGEKIAQIGPVRSARSYFVDWVKELSALLIHCGGSPDALAKIVKDRVFDLNEFYNGNYFWRDKDRLAPHNIYTSSQKLGQYLKENKASQGNFFSWQFKDDLPLEERPLATEINIFYKAPDFLVKWEYNRPSNRYQRYLAGKIHADQDGQVITAKNVVIKYVSAAVVDKDLRLKMETTGSGKAIICLDGSCQTGSWRKQTDSSRSYFYNDQMEEIKFNAGPTWIEVVRPERVVNFK